MTKTIPILDPIYAIYKPARKDNNTHQPTLCVLIISGPPTINQNKYESGLKNKTARPLLKEVDFSFLFITILSSVVVKFSYASLSKYKNPKIDIIPNNLSGIPIRNRRSKVVLIKITSAINTDATTFNPSR